MDREGEGWTGRGRGGQGADVRAWTYCSQHKLLVCVIFVIDGFLMSSL